MIGAWLCGIGLHNLKFIVPSEKVELKGLGSFQPYALTIAICQRWRCGRAWAVTESAGWDGIQQNWREVK